MRHNGLFGTETGKGAVLVLVTVFRQRNLQFWLYFTWAYSGMLPHRLFLNISDLCVCKQDRNWEPETSTFFVIIELKFACLHKYLDWIQAVLHWILCYIVNIVWFMSIHNHKLAKILFSISYKIVMFHLSPDWFYCRCLLSGQQSSAYFWNAKISRLMATWAPSSMFIYFLTSKMLML